MTKQDILFRGTRDGVIVKITGQCSFESIREAIEKQIAKSKDFFRSGKLYMDFESADIDSEHENEIKQLIFNNYGVLIHSIEGNKIKMFNGIHEGKTKFITNTIRSGQNVEFSGNVVVIGDVNAGGQIKAGGNIVVLGTLRGFVHAGASGNEKAVIAAFSLQPTQLRIANVITRSPDDEKLKPMFPELAKIKDRDIVIEPYAPNKHI